MGGNRGFYRLNIRTLSAFTRLSRYLYKKPFRLYFMKKIALWAGAWAISLTSFAQTAGPGPTPSVGSKYDPLALFHPLFNMQPGNDYRTGSGAPGPRYWQNRADYQINVRLDDQQNTVTGDVTITYKNNSPESLPFFLLQLDQNSITDR